MDPFLIFIAVLFGALALQIYLAALDEPNHDVRA